LHYKPLSCFDSSLIQALTTPSSRCGTRPSQLSSTIGELMRLPAIAAKFDVWPFLSVDFAHP